MPAEPKPCCNATCAPLCPATSTPLPSVLRLCPIAALNLCLRGATRRRTAQASPTPLAATEDQMDAGVRPIPLLACRAGGSRLSSMPRRYRPPSSPCLSQPGNVKPWSKRLWKPWPLDCEVHWPREPLDCYEEDLVPRKLDGSWGVVIRDLGQESASKAIRFLPFLLDQSLGLRHKLDAHLSAIFNLGQLRHQIEPSLPNAQLARDVISLLEEYGGYA
jgi:hypothetical protein